MKAFRGKFIDKAGGKWRPFNTFYVNGAPYDGLIGKQGQFLNDTINRWKTNGTITKDTADVLKNSFSIRPFDYKKLAEYSFWIAIACIITAVGAISELFSILFLLSTAIYAALALWFPSKLVWLFALIALGSWNQNRVRIRLGRYFLDIELSIEICLVWQRVNRRKFFSGKQR